MANITGVKMANHVGRILEDQKPITADVFLTNYCNNRCKYCTYKRWDLGNSQKAVSYDEFRKYATRLLELGVRGIILTGGGEPTLCPDFGKITKWLEDEKIHYGINTNFNNLVYFKPDYLKVSLDGYDERSYSALRGVNMYSRVIDNIRKYADWKRENSPHTKLGIQWVAQNVEDVSAFYDANSSLPVDYISFRPVESTDGKYYDVTELERAQKIKDKIISMSRNDSRIILNFKWDMLEKKQDTCIAQWAQIAVNENGDVMYCCHKPYEVVGNIMDADILEKKRAAHTNMKMCDVPCRMTAPNEFVRSVLCTQEDSCFI